MQFEFRLSEPAPTPLQTLRAGTEHVSVIFIRNPRARRYILRLRRDRVARVTIPRGGTLHEGRVFAERHGAWLEKQLSRLRAQPDEPIAWHSGSEILWRGEMVRLQVSSEEGRTRVAFGTHELPVTDAAANLRPLLERFLRGIALRELPTRVNELAALHGLDVRRVTVRNQRSRWGSCSARGTISLNWRLVQAPESVRDYIILHELMHLRQMNHSLRFWRAVAQACPDYRQAEAWLKQHAALLR